jgi:DNA-binding transcriptional LysR family regulator
MDFLGATSIFLDAVKYESFSRAADARGVRASSISRAVTNLEKEVGAQLFRRGTRRLSLTDAGEFFYARALNILAAVEDAKRIPSLYSGEPTGQLKVAAPVSFGMKHVAPLMAGFVEKYKSIRIELTLIDQRITANSFPYDIAIVLGAPEDSNLYATRIATNSYRVCCAPSMINSLSRPEFPSALSEASCIVLNQENQWLFGSANSSAEILVSVDGCFSTNNVQAATEAAIRGVGFARLPLWSASPFLKSGELVALLDNYKVVSRADYIYALHPEKLSVSPKVRLFVEHLTSNFGTPCHWDA